MKIFAGRLISVKGQILMENSFHPKSNVGFLLRIFNTHMVIGQILKENFKYTQGQMSDFKFLIEDFEYT